MTREHLTNCYKRVWKKNKKAKEIVTLKKAQCVTMLTLNRTNRVHYVWAQNTFYTEYKLCLQKKMRTLQFTYSTLIRAIRILSRNTLFARSHCKWKQQRQQQQHQRRRRNGVLRDTITIRYETRKASIRSINDDANITNAVCLCGAHTSHCVAKLD